MDRNTEPNRRRLFDDSPAVVYRTPSTVVLDRDKLPRYKDNGERYVLSCIRYRWIHFTDKPGHRYFGEWNAYTSKKEALKYAKKWES